MGGRRLTPGHPSRAGGPSGLGVQRDERWAPAGLGSLPQVPEAAAGQSPEETRGKGGREAGAGAAPRWLILRALSSRVGLGLGPAAPMRP